LQRAVLDAIFDGMNGASWGLTSNGFPHNWGKSDPCTMQNGIYYWEGVSCAWEYNEAETIREFFVT
jgi:hypothetical protein